MTITASRISGSASRYGAYVTGVANFNRHLTIDFRNGFDSTATYGLSSSGSTFVSGDLDVLTMGGGSRGMYVSAGATLVQGSAQIITQGTNGHGIVLDGTATRFQSQGANSSVSTQGSGAYGLFASGDGSLIGLGTSTTGTTTGPSIALGPAASVSTAGAGAHGIVLSSTASANVLQAGTVMVSGNGANGIDASAVAGGVSITNSGNISATDGLAILGSAGMDRVMFTAGQISGNIDLGAGNDSFQGSSGTFSGAIRMGDGDDTLNLTGNIDLQSAVQLDGGAGTDSLHLDGISLRGFTAPGNDASGNQAGGNHTNLTGWEHLQLSNNARLKLSGDLFTTTTPGALQIGAGSLLDLRGDSPGVYTIHGNVNHAGVMAMDDGAPDDVTTITGNYGGSAPAVLRTDANWTQPNTFTTDQLFIQGSASGATTVTITGGILGDVVRADSDMIASVPVVQVAQAHPDIAFVGTAATVNAGEAQLRKIGNNYFWVLEAQASATEVVPIIAASVPGYVLGPAVAREMAYSQMGKLHERIGEQQTGVWSACGAQCSEYHALVKKDSQTAPVWGRVQVSEWEMQGRDRFATKGQSGFIQFGADVSVKVDADGGRRQTGVMGTYGWGRFDNRDALRAENGVVTTDKFTGRTRADQVSVGGYSTWYAKDGGYLDLVSQLYVLRHRYSSRDGAGTSQVGHVLGLSLEGGQPLPLGGSSWTIEPQAQITYQYIAMNDRFDGTRQIQWDASHGVRGRLGARLAWNEHAGRAAGAGRSFYLTANLLHDLTANAVDVHIGRDTLTERMGNTWAELGLGAQWPIGKMMHLYGDLRVQRSINGNEGALGGANRRSVAAHWGLRSFW